MADNTTTDQGSADAQAPANAGGTAAAARDAAQAAQEAAQAAQAAAQAAGNAAQAAGSAAALGAGHRHHHDLSHFWRDTLPRLLNYLVLVISLGLIGFISWDTYNDQDFMKNALYMEYQFWACVVFLVELLYLFIISDHKLTYFIFAIPFLLICIPYLNIIQHYGYTVDHEVLYLLRFVPILRGLFALLMVVNYMTEHLAATVFASYTIVLLPVVYMSGLIFYFVERHVNSAVKNFWYAQWWSAMNFTTVGCYINPVTPTGMILGLILSLLGIIMLPLFTVYFGSVVRVYSNKTKHIEKIFRDDD